jgi:predicted deacetylase
MKRGIGITDLWGEYIMMVNISIDDVSPHPKSSVKVLDNCYDIIEFFPEVKFTIFVPMNYRRMGERAYPICDFPDFCETLKELPKSNFELGWHGYYHGIPKKSNNDEFASFNNYDEVINRIKLMKEMAHKASVIDCFKPIFRPPAFRMAACAFRALKDSGIDILALSPKQSVRMGYRGQDENFGKVVYYNANPPDIPLKLFPSTEIVYHACEWDRSYLSEELKKELMVFLEEVKDVSRFVYMEDMI